MKKILIVLALGGAAMLAGTIKTNAQLLSNGGSSKYQKDLPGDQNTISPKAIRGFAKKYRDVNSESWIQVKDGFSARFNSDGIDNSILYDKKGKWAGSIKSYSEDKLPLEIRHIVKSVYYDYKIVHIQEIETLDSRGTPTYIVFLEDKISLKMVRIFDGEMKPWKDFKKSIY